MDNKNEKTYSQWLMEGYQFPEIPHDELTETVCMSAVKSDPMLLGFIPKQFQTDRVHYMALMGNPYAIGDIPEEHLDSKKVLTAMCFYNSQHDFSPVIILDGIPEQFITEEIAAAAVCFQPDNLKYVPDKYKKSGLVIAAEHFDSVYGSVKDRLTEVGKKMITHGEEMLDELYISGDIDSVIRYVDEHLSDSESKDNSKSQSEYLQDVVDDPWCIKDVPEDMITKEMCWAAINNPNGFNSGELIKHIPNKFVNQRLCDMAVKHSDFGKAIKYVPDEYKNDRLCDYALRRDGRNLEHIPVESRTYDRCLSAVSNYGLALEHVPKGLLQRNREDAQNLCDAAVQNNFLALDAVPNTYKTYDMCLNALHASEGAAFSIIPYWQKTEDLCVEALQYDFHHIDEIPDDMKTDKIKLMEINHKLQQLSESSANAEISDVVNELKDFVDSKVPSDDFLGSPASDEQYE